MKELIPRKYNIGQLVITKSGVVARVIGSAIYGVVKNKPTKFAHVEYRLKKDGAKRTFYRREDELQSLQFGDPQYGVNTYDPYIEHPYAEHWKDSIAKLVHKVAVVDMRYSAIDTFSGAHIFQNPNDFPPLFFVESPNGENMHGANSRMGARHILSCYRRGTPWLI